MYHEEYEEEDEGDEEGDDTDPFQNFEKKAMFRWNFKFFDEKKLKFWRFLNFFFGVVFWFCEITKNHKIIKYNFCKNQKTSNFAKLKLEKRDFVSELVKFDLRARVIH